MFRCEFGEITSKNKYFFKPIKDFEPSGKTEITFEGVELIRNDEIFRDQGQGSTDHFGKVVGSATGILGRSLLKYLVELG